MPLIPAEPRLRHCSLNRSTGSLACFVFSIFLHFCLISVSDLDVAAMLLSIVCNKYGALWKSRRFYFPLPWQPPGGTQSVYNNRTVGSKSFFPSKLLRTYALWAGFSKKPEELQIQFEWNVVVKWGSSWRQTNCFPRQNILKTWTY